MPAASWYLNMALLARSSGSIFHFSNNCFYKFPRNLTKLQLGKEYPCTLAPCKHISVKTRSFNTDPISANGTKKKYLVFEKAISQRRDQANRSILVQVQSQQSGNELYDYCSQFGKVEEMHHYTLSNNVHFILIEFKTLSDANSVTSASVHTNIEHLPVISPMLWFRAVPKHKINKSSSTDILTRIKNNTVIPSSEAINDLLFKAKSISDQMLILINSTKLNDTDTRLRFLTARQIEMCLSGMFSNISVLPFGSSVNGFGKQGCDLDLVLRMQAESKEDANARLVYHTKAGGLSERAQAQKVMETIADVMQQFLPGVMGIRKILKARVPIVKYNHSLTGLECDFSMTNTIGIYMSELLYLYGELDWRVRPLTFTVRTWASSVHLTNNAPGGWITNFSLTLLILFYLQQKKILPSLQTLVQLADKNDIRIAGGYVDCTFLRDISRLPGSSTPNNESLENLMGNFFTYYSSFDFATQAISLNTGTPLRKPDSSPIYIFNPLEQGLNVAKNINVQETERLKVEMRNAAWLLESGMENNVTEWGLLSLFHRKLQHTQSTVLAHGERILKVASLFQKPSNLGNTSQDNENVRNRNILKGVNSSISTNGERQVTRNAKSKFGRNQGWRR